MDVSGSTPKRPLFIGESGRACEEFVRDVRLYAFSQGKQRDGAWMADFASTCLDGAALRFFSELELEVQEDWSLLNKALLRQYPSDKILESATVPSPAAAPPPGPFPQLPSPTSSIASYHRRELKGSPSSSSTIPASSSREVTIPTPAAAPPRPLVSTASVAQKDRPDLEGPLGSFTSSVREALESVPTTAFPQPHRLDGLAGQAPSAAPRAGRIKIIIDPDGAMPKVRYIHRKMSWFDLFKYTSTVSDALHVSYTPSVEPGVFKMLNGPKDYTCLGITWESKQDNPVLGPGSSLWAEVTAVTQSPDGKIVTASSETGASGAEVWTVGPDETIHGTWKDGSDLQMFIMKDRVFVAGDYTQFVHDSKTFKARWVFEPF